MDVEITKCTFMESPAETYKLLLDTDFPKQISMSENNYRKPLATKNLQIEYLKSNGLNRVSQNSVALNQLMIPILFSSTIYNIQIILNYYIRLIYVPEILREVKVVFIIKAGVVSKDSLDGRIKPYRTTCKVP